MGCSAGCARPIFKGMAAILFVVAILGLLLTGRTQASAVYGSKPLFRFELWQLALALALPIICAADLPTLSKVIAVVLTASAFSFSVHRARHAHETEDFDF
jgi:hypothetical protein